MDIVGFGIDYPPHVDLVARWTTPSCSGGVGDGVICTASELVADNKGKLTSQRRVYVPSIEPAVHVYDLDTKTKQPDVEELLQKYPFKLGREILFEVDKRKTSPLRAADCQTAGRGWIVAVGEGEKIIVWKRKDGRDRIAAKGGIEDLLRSLSLLEERDDTPLTAGDADGALQEDALSVSGHIVSPILQAQTKQTNGVHSTTPPEEANVVNTIEVRRQLGTAVEAALEEPAGLQMNAAINGHTTIDEEAKNPTLPADDRMFLRSPSVEYVS